MYTQDIINGGTNQKKNLLAPLAALFCKKHSQNGGIARYCVD